MASASGDRPRTAVPDKEPNVNGFDTSVAHPARIWDYWLGGKDNYAADRAFLASVVHHLVTGLGIRQFLDIGTGLPAASNTHEVAREAAPESRVVYVDNDRCKSSCAHDRG